MTAGGPTPRTPAELVAALRAFRGQEDGDVGAQETSQRWGDGARMNEAPPNEQMRRTRRGPNGASPLI